MLGTLVRSLSGGDWIAIGRNLNLCWVLWLSKKICVMGF
jgi:hypothetical protein